MIILDNSHYQETADRGKMSGDEDMDNNNRKKREVRPLGVIALVMAIIYSIPIVLMFFVDNPVIKIFGFAAIPITIISYATAKMYFWKTPATNIRISYIGHMCFSLDCDEQTVIIDPYKAGSVPGLKPVKGKANKVLITDEEKSDAEAVRIKKSRKPLPFEITEFVPANGIGKMYMLDNGDHRIVHLGALNCKLTDEQKDLFRNSDVLMIPVGGKYTIDETEAAELALELLPEYVMPMYFKAANYGLEDIGTGAMFANELRKNYMEKEGSENTHCPTTIRLAARNGKEKGLASVEVRNRDESKK